MPTIPSSPKVSIYIHKRRGDDRRRYKIPFGIVAAGSSTVNGDIRRKRLEQARDGS